MREALPALAGAPAALVPVAQLHELRHGVGVPQPRRRREPEAQGLARRGRLLDELVRRHELLHRFSRDAACGAWAPTLKRLIQSRSALTRFICASYAACHCIRT